MSALVVGLDLPLFAAAGEADAEESIPDPRPPAEAGVPSVAEPWFDAPPRDAREVGREDDVLDEDVAEELSAVEPAEPVVSAAAIGTDATADPTPKATASRPTRPI